MLLLFVANSVKVVISHSFAQCSKSDQNSFFNSFAQCSKWGQIITSSVSLLSMANMIKLVICRCFSQGSKFGQIPLYSRWQIWSKQWFPILFPIVAKLIKYQFFCIFAQDGKYCHDSIFPYFKWGKQSWLKYHFFTLSLKTSLSTCFLFLFGTINDWQTI